jgi:predicted methyltransferase
MKTKIVAGVVTLALAVAAMAATPALATKAFPTATKALAPKFTDESDSIADAVAGPQRSAADKARDGARHPIQSLTFWGLRPGDTILEISPGGGYWTAILAPFAHKTGGHYVGLVSEKGKPGFLAKYADAATYGEVTAVSLDKAGSSLTTPGTVDFILTARNIHNFIWDKSVDTILAQSFAALKPGGVLAIEEHRADPRPMKPGVEDGYVSEAFVIDAARKAGFELVARSEINANPKDTKDHPFGVWTLPPARQSAPSGKPADPAFDHSRYDAIGESDRMTLRFRKPA